MLGFWVKNTYLACSLHYDIIRMSKPRVLYISQHLTPYLPETTMSHVSRMLPQGTHEKGKEIRVFMPRFGKINERRHQLHEVIRLSGMNLNVNDTDHPLIIKVASIPSARIQVYFIDNDTYFKRKACWKTPTGTSSQTTMSAAFSSPAACSRPCASWVGRQTSFTAAAG